MPRGQESHLDIIAQLSDLGLGSRMRILQHCNVITPGCQLTLAAGHVPLQGCIVGLHASVFCQQGLQEEPFPIEFSQQSPTSRIPSTIGPALASSMQISEVLSQGSRPPIAGCTSSDDCTE